MKIREIVIRKMLILKYNRLNKINDFNKIYIK